MGMFCVSSAAADRKYRRSVKILHQTAWADLTAVRLVAVKDGYGEGVSFNTYSELLAAVRGRDLAGTDREGAREQLSPPLPFPLLAMASFICHHPYPLPDPLSPFSNPDIFVSGTERNSRHFRFFSVNCCAANCYDRLLRRLPPAPPASHLGRH